MKDIKCPSCGKTFRIDPSSFEEILLQIKDEEFNKQIKERLILAEEDNKKALEILKRELKIQLIEQNRIKESEIQTLESKLKIAEEKKTNALNELKNQATNKINSLNNELVKLKDEIKTQSLISELSLKNKVNAAVTNLEKENSSLTNSIEKMRLEHSINEKLIEENIKITFEGSTRANLIKEDQVKLMVEAGLIRLSFGLETVDSEMRKTMKMHKLYSHNQMIYVLVIIILNCY